MNILIVTETYPPEINGVARTLAQMVSGLSKLGHRITLVCPKQKQRPSDDEPAEIHPVRGLPLPGYPGLQFGMPAGGLIKRLIAHKQIDACYIATEGPLGHSAMRACHRAGVPCLSGMHTNFHQYSGHYNAGMLAPALWRYLRGFHNKLAGTLVPTGAMADELEDSGFRNLHVWPRGVHANLFSPDRRNEELRARWGIGSDDIVVVYVGRLAPEKNIDTTFEAFSAIRERHPTARMVLVGNGPAEKRLRATHPEAIFAGPRTGVELAEYYASGDMFLFSSVTETFGNVTLEAMASGLAVVSYDLAAAHELINHGHNGLLAPADDKAAFIQHSLDCAGDAALRQTLKVHARETALQQDWPKLIDRLEKLFLAVQREATVDDRENTATSTERP
ncbi:glycosyltransferase family 4 protein [Thiosocius teredinicola]|uniref:glycosyltransferase family 4 protein n=1 Tax=Thiosocius teredinicola TaxID=1973002 RepID=UPI000991299B